MGINCGNKAKQKIQSTRIWLKMEREYPRTEEKREFILILLFEEAESSQLHLSLNSYLPQL